MAELALFDLDNTLLDRAGAFRRWTNDFVERNGYPEDAVATIIELDEEGYKRRPQFFADLRAAFSLTPSVEELQANYDERYPSFFRVEESTVESLRRLRSLGWKIVVVTNGAPTQWNKLNATKLTGEVDAVCISAELDIWKPNPGIFEEAARRCGVALDGWMVGDSASADIVGGHNVGLRTIWMHRGQSWDEELPPPTATAASIAEAVDHILSF